jgi:hypothetical protein
LIPLRVEVEDKRIKVPCRKFTATFKIYCARTAADQNMSAVFWGINGQFVAKQHTPSVEDWNYSYSLK